MIITEGKYKKMLSSSGEIDSLDIIRKLGDDAHRIEKAEEVSHILEELLKFRDLTKKDHDENADKAFIHVYLEKMKYINDICVERKCNEFIRFLAACLGDNMIQLKQMIDEAIKVESEDLKSYVSINYFPVTPQYEALENEDEDDNDPYGVGNDSIFDDMDFTESGDSRVINTGNYTNSTK